MRFTRFFLSTLLSVVQPQEIYFTAIEFCTDLLGSVNRDFCQAAHLPQISAETQLSRFADFSWSGICSACLLLCRILGGQNGDLRGPIEFLNHAFQTKMGSPLQESANLQMPIAAPDFCLSRAERVWDVICAIWDLLRCTEICKSAVIDFSAGREIYSADFSPPQTSLLGSGICCLRARRLGRARRLVRWLFVAHRALMVCGP